MSRRTGARIVGAYEHPDRVITGKSVEQVHAEVALGALADAGLGLEDVDGYCCSGDAPGLGPISMAQYLGLSRLTFVDSLEIGGSSPVAQLGHAAAAIAAGKCRVVLITLAGLPRSGAFRPIWAAPEAPFETVYGPTTPAMYALAARRHMHEYGTTAEQLAEIKVAASLHAQHNPNAFLRRPVTVEEVLESPWVSEPLHRLDCCVVTDGGGAIVVAAPEVAKDLGRRSPVLLGHGEALKHGSDGRLDLTYTAAVRSGPTAFEEAGVTVADVDYASIYDSFTITVLITLEDLGFAERGKGGWFVADGGLLAPHGRLPVNTDGGGLCNNHPASRGGMTKIIEAVRQLRGEAHPAVQVPNCEIALVHGTGGSLGSRMASVTAILGVEE
ncbi:acetyl-CoA C-acetyltransferase [Pseudonocardia thermophila]|jgi:Acetyl-CoA acetyltransferase|uniref:Acetyl-CoA C-acetyltransferase n=1 Tax=Pseudonocardia thermophila TaxID=1848 RepID=A0A1M6XPS4_PSETH|nr:thiolase domain-containing protein [Pseudonocardia thermophila]SHL08010.1 acetyl-CoA C-acetyltransferase [Pseudonocardia thermophila]